MTDVAAVMWVFMLLLSMSAVKTTEQYQTVCVDATYYLGHIKGTSCLHYQLLHLDLFVTTTIGLREDIHTYQGVMHLQHLSLCWSAQTEAFFLFFLVCFVYF